MSATTAAEASGATAANNSHHRKNTTSGSVNAKLLHLVRKLIVESASITTATPDQLIPLLRAQHREYQRKDSIRLRASVQQAIQIIRQQHYNPQHSQPQHDDDDDDDSYDRAAAAHDAAAAAAAATISSLGASFPANGLNASLRQHYERHDPGKDSNSAKRRATQSETGDAILVQHAPVGSSTTTSGKRRRKLKHSIGSSAAADVFGSSDGSPVKEWLQPRPKERYTDLGGLTGTVQMLRQLVEYPITRPELYRHLGVDPPRGVLLRGPPGT